MSFAFTVWDSNTGQILGGGVSDLDGEAGFVAANAEFEKHYPEREIHVEEITIAQYVKQTGNAPLVESTWYPRKRELQSIKEKYSDERRTEIQ